MKEEFMSIRERIVDILRRSDRPLTVHEIALELGLEPGRESEIYEHLEHIAKSIRRESGFREALIMELPRCKKCGYVFRDLKKPRKPSRCPRCKSEWIEPPRFKIERIA